MSSQEKIHQFLDTHIRTRADALVRAGMLPIPRKQLDALRRAFDEQVAVGADALLARLEGDSFWVSKFGDLVIGLGIENGGITVFDVTYELTPRSHTPES